VVILGTLEAGYFPLSAALNPKAGKDSNLLESKVQNIWLLLLLFTSTHNTLDQP
jgi:hypothetical protein